MRSKVASLFGALTVSLATASAGYANEFTDSIAKAFEDDVVKVAFRLRYETVDDDAKPQDASALTLKSRLTLAPKLDDWLFLAQIDNVAHIADRFNDTRNGKGAQYPTVADPDGTDINQAFIRYSGFEGTQITAGRQAIVRGNKRFVGGVEWRQNEQTYDSASVGYKKDNVAVYYAYVDSVRRIFGPDSGTPAKDLDSKTHLIDGSYSFSPALKLAAYGYFMDFEDDAPGLSNQTLGLRLTGKVDVADGVNVAYQAEYANQKDYEDNPNDYDADYMLLDATVNLSQVSLRAGYEVLGGDVSGGQGFQTPLATLHKFQGWADQFLGTPDTGIEDTYLGITTKQFGVKFALYYHDFSQEEGSGDYGDEIDVSAAYKINKNYAVLVKAAQFNADSSSGREDVTKVWLQLQASF